MGKRKLFSLKYSQQEYYMNKIRELILYRLLQNDGIETFHLAFYKDYYSFRNIVTKIKLKETDKPVLVFIKIGYNTNYTKEFKLTTLFRDLVESYIRERDKFIISNKDDFYNTPFDQTECLFVLYTNEKISHNIKTTKQAHKYTNILNDLLTTRESGFQLKDKKSLDTFLIQKEISVLAVHIDRYIEDCDTVMNDPVILRYHVLLAKNVFEIVEEGLDLKTRIWKYRQDFFHPNKDVNLCFLRMELAKLYKMRFSGKFGYKTEDELIKKLTSLKFKLPNTFGNVDINIGGTKESINRRLDHVANVIEALYIKSFDANVLIDNSDGDNVFKINGGISSAIGNLFQMVGDNKSFILTTSAHLLKNNAKYLYDRLHTKFGMRLEMLVFSITDKSTTFPRLTFEVQENTKLILSNLFIYEQQSDYDGIEILLKNEIEQHLRAANYQIDTELYYSCFHNEVVKWWMTSANNYITKNCNLLEQVLNNAIKEPVMSKLQNMFFKNYFINKYWFYNYMQGKSSKYLGVYPRLMVVTNTQESWNQMVVEILSYMNEISRNKCTILDLEHVNKLTSVSNSKLLAELHNTTKNIILTYNVTEGSGDVSITRYNLESVAQVTLSKPIIVITSNGQVVNLKDYFTDLNMTEFGSGQGKLIVKDTSNKTNISSNLSKLINNAKVLLQGVEISLNSLVYNDLLPFIKGTVLGRIVNNKPIEIGNALGNANYNDNKDTFMDRSIRKQGDANCEDINSLDDIESNIILIVGVPGIGKSSLLTHLAVNTVKENATRLWVINTNLPAFSEQFSEWRRLNTSIDISEAFKFICKVALKNNTGSFTFNVKNDNIVVNCVDDDLLAFELQLFQQFYNNNRLVLLFDAFDEVCTYYRIIVIKLLDIIRKSLKKYKMLVTSRSYAEILPDLEEVLGKPYEMNGLTFFQSSIYLEKVWQMKLPLNINYDDLINVIPFLLYIKEDISSRYNLKESMFFFVYIKFYMNLYLNTRDERFVARSCRTGAGETNNSLIGSPQILCLVADYLTNIVLSKINHDWDWEKDIVYTYKMIVKKKIKDVLHQDKNKINVYLPFNKANYKQSKIKCLNKHKRLAAHNCFLRHNYYDVPELKEIWPFDPEDNKDLKSLTDTINIGDEKTGLILYSTPEDITVFIHDSFEEYFFNEYMCDVYRSHNFTIKQKVAYRSTISDCVWMQRKRKIDEELNVVIQALDNWSNEPHWYHRVVSRVLYFLARIFVLRTWKF